jgi:hypothetical protein
MATYASLTTEEKNILQNMTNMLRGWAGEQARTNNHAEVINDDYNAQVVTLLTSLDAGEVIPNTSGLAGAASLTKEEVTTLVSHVQNILTDMSTHTSGFNTTTLRQAWTKAAGAANLIG